MGRIRLLDLYSYLFFFITYSCGQQQDRQEVLSKLRGLGVAVNPLVPRASVEGDPQKVTLTVSAVVPLQQTIKVEYFEDKPSPRFISLKSSQIKIEDPIDYTDYSNFQLVSFNISVDVPDASEFAKTNGVGLVRYGFKMISGSEEEKVVGTFLVYPKGAPQLLWENPKIDLKNPSAGAVLRAGQTTEVQADFSNPNAEEFKVAWFTSGGKIINRRNKKTKWELPTKGNHTLIVTVHGKKSRSFSIMPVKIVAE
ncbi:MAG: hypothetical protein KA436_03550 [Oligoflexales bacterium]|nr:hypothetical protein [Oligoflexales bacterium]